MENMEPTFVRLSGLLFSTAHVNSFLDFEGDCGAGDDFMSSMVVLFFMVVSDNILKKSWK